MQGQSDAAAKAASQAIAEGANVTIVSAALSLVSPPENQLPHCVPRAAASLARNEDMEHISANIGFQKCHEQLIRDV